jgi:phosphoinositide-3-kinase regulatory subunit 4
MGLFDRLCAVQTHSLARCAFLISSAPELNLKDNPADFAFFFDSSSRRSCYLAPERFYTPGDGLFIKRTEALMPEMDIFSLG